MNIRQNVPLIWWNWREMMIFLKKYVDTIVAKISPKLFWKYTLPSCHFFVYFVVQKHSVFEKNYQCFDDFLQKTHLTHVRFSPKCSWQMVFFNQILLIYRTWISILLLFLRVNPHFFRTWLECPLFYPNKRFGSQRCRCRQPNAQVWGKKEG